MTIERIIIGNASSGYAATTSWATFTNNESWDLNLSNAKQIAYDAWQAASFTGGLGFAIVGDNLSTSSASNLAVQMVQYGSGNGAAGYNALAIYPGSPHGNGGYETGVPNSSDEWTDYYDSTNNVWWIIGSIQDIDDPSESGSGSGGGSGDSAETSNFAINHTQAYGSNPNTVIDHGFSGTHSINENTLTTPFNRLKTKVDAQSTHSLDDLILQFLLEKERQPANRMKLYDFIERKV